MIFLVLFGGIAIIVIILNMMDSSNLKKIEEHFKVNNCQEVVYSKGLYKGICDDKIMQIPNSFSIDISKDKSIIKLGDINKINKENLTISINKDYKIEFKEKENLENFYKKLEEKLNK